MNREDYKDTEITRYCKFCERFHLIKDFRLRKQTINGKTRWYRNNVCWEAEKKQKQRWNRTYYRKVISGEKPMPPAMETRGYVQKNPDSQD